ncbi:GFA family protein, partial [Curvivirga aplysinae]|uniref:GFA family protein n=1 Tax=Curvivirga aplysinae TaxID=2529852 RepID=UPI0012BC4BBE
CQCGNVRLVVSCEPDRVGICHCMDCRKHHGALFYAAAVFPKDAVEIAGDTKEYKGRFFCPNCGSSVYAKSDNEIEIHLGSMDEPNQFTPTYELWTKHREGWLPEFTSTQCFRKNREE